MSVILTRGCVPLGSLSRVTKETCQKRLTYTSEETCMYVKRHLYMYVSGHTVTLPLSRVTKETRESLDLNAVA